MIGVAHRQREVDRIQPTEEGLAAAYGLLFEPTMRAAQIACLGFAQLVRDDFWPDPKLVCVFARVYGVPAAELGAFFGHISYRQGTRTVWVDALSGTIPTWTALNMASDKQSLSLGYMRLLTSGLAGRSASDEE